MSPWNNTSNIVGHNLPFIQSIHTANAVLFVHVANDNLCTALDQRLGESLANANSTYQKRSGLSLYRHCKK